jgi:hypothetical protein
MNELLLAGKVNADPAFPQSALSAIKTPAKSGKVFADVADVKPLIFADLFFKLSGNVFGIFITKQRSLNKKIHNPSGKPICVNLRSPISENLR